MDTRKHLAGASATPPTPPASPSTGYPTDGNPLTNTPATSAGAWWYYQLSEEQRNVILAASIAPDHTVTNQLLAALNAGWGMPKSLGANGYIKLPGGFILQWGRVQTNPATQRVSAVFSIPFPNQFLCAVATHDGSGGAMAVLDLTTATNSQVDIVVSTVISGTGTGALFATYFAIGY